MIKFFKGLLLTIFSFFIFAIYSNANSIQSIDADVYIDVNGDANITEKWSTILDSGTEGYKPYTNLGNMYISDFSVSDESGKTYDFNDEWNTNASFAEKVYKYGYHYTNDGVELCWGISNYGNKIYIINYKINNFVKQYDDAQAIYFDFLNLDQDVGKVKITIRSDTHFSLDNSKIWGFGYKGSINFVDGDIVMTSEGMLPKAEFMTALVRFDENLFNTNNYVNGNFDELYDLAFSDNKTRNHNVIKSILHFLKTAGKIILKHLMIPILLIIFIVILVFRKRDYGYYRFCYNNMIYPSSNDDTYYQNIPCNNDLELAYWICYQYQIVSDNQLRKGIISAYFLKWIHENKIKVFKTNREEFGVFGLGKITFDLSNLVTETFSNNSEKKLALFMLSASNEDKLLNSDDFNKWSKNNFKEFNYWYISIFSDVKTSLMRNNLLYSSSENSKEIDTISSDINEEAAHLNGLKNFLLDYGNIEEKELIEIYTFEQYLIFAALFGIAEKVEAQFKKQYPDYFVKYDYDFSLIHEIAASCFASYSKALSSYEHYHPIKSRSLFKESNSQFESSTHDYSGTSRESGRGGGSFTNGGKSSGGSSGGGFR